MSPGLKLWVSTKSLHVVRSPRLIAHLTGDSDNVSGADFSPDGKQVVTASDDRSVRVWDAASGQELYQLEIFDQAVRKAHFAPDGGSVLSVGEDKVVRVTPIGAFEDPQLRDADPNKVMARVCAAYLVNGVQTLEPYEQTVVAQLASRSAASACPAPGAGAWLVWSLLGALVLAVAGAGAWAWRQRGRLLAAPPAP